jgi:peptidoglycan hydrolase CwlO-like protein
MMKRTIFVGALCLLFLVVIASPLSLVKADDLSDKQAEIEQLKAKLKEIQGQKQTLSKTIDYLNTKITLTQKEISATQTEIAGLEEEVQALSGKIVILDSNLEKLTTYWISRVQSMYMRTQATQPMYLLLTSNGLQDLMMRFKYLKVSQRQDRKDMNTLESMKINFDAQKNQKEIKQTDLEKAKKKLEGQKIALAQQQAEKQNLLQVTRNDESKFQTLLNEAVLQLAAMRSFITSSGGAGILTNQTKCDDWGCYYNQRDAQWGNIHLGSSNLTMAGYGCLVTSVSMVAKHDGKDIKPIDIAISDSAFFSPKPDTAKLLWSFSVKGISVTISSSSVSQLDSILSSGRPVIVGLYAHDAHFIVLKKKTDKGYIMNDPYLENGSDVLFTDHYSTSNINSLRLVSFN